MPTLTKFVESIFVYLFQYPYYLKNYHRKDRQSHTFFFGFFIEAFLLILSSLTRILRITLVSINALCTVFSYLLYSLFSHLFNRHTNIRKSAGIIKNSFTFFQNNFIISFFYYQRITYFYPHLLSNIFRYCYLS